VFSPDDTIVAIATPHGHSGIGVVRLSGPDALRIAAALSGRRLEPRRATFATLQIEGIRIDQAVFTFFAGPHSYTGQDVVEISAHGSPVLLQTILSAALDDGARLAEPGEFTLRAYLGGRVDLVQAEAVRDLVDAVTPLQARAAFDQLEGTLTARIHEIDRQLFELTARLEASLDFPDEGYHFIESGEAGAAIGTIIAGVDALLATASRGRLIREGAHVAITGKPNAGKSSLFNQLAGTGRAIVTDVPGTTRDLVSERVDVGGVPITLVDTAGLRAQTTDPIEVEGIARARAARDTAAAVIVVLDRSRALDEDDRALLAEARGPRVVVANKIDLAPARWDEGTANGVIEVSAKTGEGMDALRTSVVEALGGAEILRDAPMVTNIRHRELLQRARAALAHARAAAERGTPEEFVLADLADARSALEEITGARTAEDVLRAIFDTFCIGK
jgi:tRNA modification GTPase